MLDNVRLHQRVGLVKNNHSERLMSGHIRLIIFRLTQTDCVSCFNRSRSGVQQHVLVPGIRKRQWLARGRCDQSRLLWRWQLIRRAADDAADLLWDVWCCIQGLIAAIKDTEVVTLSSNLFCRLEMCLGMIEVVKPGFKNNPHPSIKTWLRPCLLLYFYYLYFCRK